MIRRLVIVPGTPLLLSSYATRTDPIRDLRTRARALVDSLVAEADRCAVVAATDLDARHSGAPVGVRIAEELLGRAPDDQVVVPWDSTPDVCRALGSQLASRCDAAGEPSHGGRPGSGAGSGAGSGGGSTGLLVIADGCATRTEKAPGHFDARAAGMDADWLRALGGTEFRCLSPAPMQSYQPTDLESVGRIDPQALLDLDPEVAGELLFQGRAPLQVLAGAIEGRAPRPQFTATDVMVGDPFGVRYVLLAAR